MRKFGRNAGSLVVVNFLRFLNLRERQNEIIQFIWVRMTAFVRSSLCLP